MKKKVVSGGVSNGTPTDAEVVRILLEEREKNRAPPPPRKVRDIKEMRFW